MPKNAPIINGRKPDALYDLDNQSDLLKLGLGYQAELKIADKYAHYQNCKYAVIELKSNTLRKAVEQLDSTVKRLVSVGKKVDLAIVVINRLNRYEQRSFKRRKDKILINPQTNQPYTIRVGNDAWNILLFYASEANKTSHGMDKYLSGGMA
jgi:hypothetical protein